MLFLDVVGDIFSLNQMIQNIPVSKILAGIVTLAVCILVAHLPLRLSDKLLKRTKLDPGLHRFIRSILRILLYFVAILLVAGTLGIDVTSLVALLSVVSLAVSLAVQDVLSNVAGGSMVMATKPFKQGDWVDIDGTSGTVEEIGMVYTTIVGIDNRRVFIPNSKVSNAVIQNYTALGRRRLELTFTASYDSEPETVKAALLEAMDIPEIGQEERMVHVLEYGDSSITYQVRAWVEAGVYAAARYALIERVWDCFQARGIEMTYPHLNVHLDKEGEKL